MLFVIHFKDAPTKLHVRREQMSAHLAFLEKHSATIRVAGSLRDEVGDTPVGGMWIVDAANYDEARQLFSDDPFWTEGLRESVKIFRLAKAFPETNRLV